MDESWIKIVSAVISVISIFINLYFKTYDLLGLAEFHKQSALEFLKIRENLITLLCEIKMQNIDEEELIKKKNENLDTLMELYKNTKDASKKAVDLASDCLKNRGDNTYSDAEIDSYLPIFLRKN